MFDLVSGVNRISFKTRKPFCPNVEFIKVTQDEQNRQISSEKYDQYIDEISNYKKAALAEAMAGSGLKSAPDPQINYKFQKDVNFKYSYYTTLLLNDDETYTFETTNATGDTDPVIHLINTHNPSVSWTDDNGAPPPDNVNAKLTVDTEWYAGYYYLFIRKAGTSDGTCNLKMDGTTIASNCAVSGSRIECETDNEGTLNWFTADLNNGDSHIWLENKTGTPGKIIKYNDDWTVSSDFSWGNNSRIRKNVYNKVRAFIVSSHSSYNPPGTCDLYMNCMNYPDHVNFDSLKSNDAIQSAPRDEDGGYQYNCFGWSGGRYWSQEFPFDPGNPWYDPDGILASFDNYYANRNQHGTAFPRYPGGAMNFIRSSTAGGASVALWGVDVESIDHASVKKPANDHPHGYDWESKDGPFYRFFHPKDALVEGVYGSISILQYYRWDEENNPYTYPPSKKSTAFLEIEELAGEKQVLIKSMVQTYPDQTRFEEMYESWKNTWDDPKLVHHSNPRMFAKSKQYTTLLGYCQNIGKEVWPLVFNKYLDGAELNILLIGDLTFKDYLWMMLNNSKVKKYRV